MLHNKSLWGLFKLKVVNQLHFPYVVEREHNLLQQHVCLSEAFTGSLTVDDCSVTVGQ